MNSPATADIDRALTQALACRDDRKRAEEALAVLRRKEEDAIELLQALVQSRGAREANHKRINGARAFGSDVPGSRDQVRTGAQ